MPCQQFESPAVERMKTGSKLYSVQEGIESALNQLLESSNDLIPREVKSHAQAAVFKSNGQEDQTAFPCPLKETEAISALKAVEAGVLAAVADLQDGREARRISLNVERAVCSLFAAYLSMIDDMWKGDLDVKTKLKGVLCQRHQFE